MPTPQEMDDFDKLLGKYNAHDPPPATARGGNDRGTLGSIERALDPSPAMERAADVGLNVAEMIPGVQGSSVDTALRSYFDRPQPPGLATTLKRGLGEALPSLLAGPIGPLANAVGGAAIGASENPQNRTSGALHGLGAAVVPGALGAMVNNPVMRKALDHLLAHGAIYGGSHFLPLMSWLHGYHMMPARRAAYSAVHKAVEPAWNQIGNLLGILPRSALADWAGQISRTGGPAPGNSVTRQLDAPQRSPASYRPYPEDPRSPPAPDEPEEPDDEETDQTER